MHLFSSNHSLSGSSADTKPMFMGGGGGGGGRHEPLIPSAYHTTHRIHQTMSGMPLITGHHTTTLPPHPPPQQPLPPPPQQPPPPPPQTALNHNYPCVHPHHSMIGSPCSPSISSNSINIWTTIGNSTLKNHDKVSARHIFSFFQFAHHHFFFQSCAIGSDAVVRGSHHAVANEDDRAGTCEAQFVAKSETSVLFVARHRLCAHFSAASLLAHLLFACVSKNRRNRDHRHRFVVFTFDQLQFAGNLLVRFVRTSRQFFAFQFIKCSRLFVAFTSCQSATVTSFIIFIRFFAIHIIVITIFIFFFFIIVLLVSAPLLQSSSFECPSDRTAVTLDARQKRCSCRIQHIRSHVTTSSHSKVGRRICRVESSVSAGESNARTGIHSAEHRLLFATEFAFVLESQRNRAVSTSSQSRQTRSAGQLSTALFVRHAERRQATGLLFQKLLQRRTGDRFPHAAHHSGVRCEH